MWGSKFVSRSQSPVDHISVCVCTYRRNEQLQRLLCNLAIQRTEGLFDYSIVVVDNDADGHARETVAQLQSKLILDITYSIEPERTIPAARNHALGLARGNYIGIIDDDELPPAGLAPAHVRRYTDVCRRWRFGAGPPVLCWCASCLAGKIPYV